MADPILRGGPSKQRLPGQSEIDAAAEALAQRSVQPYMKAQAAPAPRRPGVVRRAMAPPPPPEPEADVEVAQPEDEALPPLEGTYSVYHQDDGVHVTLWDGDGRAYTGEGQSIVEALSVAAGKLEVEVEAPRCPHCGQVMPEEGTSNG